MHFLNMLLDMYPYIAGTVFLVEVGCVEALQPVQLAGRFQSDAGPGW